MNVSESIDKCAVSTLSQTVDEYLINRGVDKKKYFGKYLVISKRVWQSIFWQTLWVTKTVWLPLKHGQPHHYIDTPRDAVRIFSINTIDHCGKIVSLFYNNQLNVTKIPHEKKCGCTACGCSGLCEDVNSFQVTTKLLFTINNVSYYEKTWLKYCPNGDIWEYKEIPTKKYLDYTGDAGDYNTDYNDDYSQANAFSNFTIVTETFQNKICRLDIKPCGCPQESPVNEKLLIENCSCFLPLGGITRRCYCDPFLADPGPNLYGQVKLSECGSKIYFRPPIHRFTDQCIVGQGPIPKLPSHLQVSYQTDGLNIDQDTLIPDYALMAMWTGIDWRSKLFNSKYSLNEKKSMEYQHNDAVNNIIKFLAPFNMERLASIQDAPIVW